MIYTGITIGPIIRTLSMAQKPRELWIASYMFSYLMECIVDTIKAKTDKEVISPGVIEGNSAKVGLYPDRLFIRSADSIVLDNILKDAKKKFGETTKFEETTIDNYFNIMYTSVSAETDKEGVKLLNQRLNYLELVNMPIENDVVNKISNFVKEVNNNPLYSKGLGSSRFTIDTLAEIATNELKKTNREEWKNSKRIRVTADKINSSVSDEFRLNDEDYFYTDLRDTFGKVMKSHHKYICVVQADGDGMGNIVSNVKQGGLLELSNNLLKFGCSATKKIEDYGGLPIYAGGDDLLFIAPVVSCNNGKKESILDLISEIDQSYEKVKQCVVKVVEDKQLSTGMSYGVSLTYYKYPLYEALAAARSLLFEKAKNIVGKNSIAWNLQKHSGGSFEGSFSKTNADLLKAFGNLVQKSDRENLVSAVAHKLRSSKALLKLILFDESENQNSRWKAFADKTLEYQSKTESERSSIDAVKNIVFQVFFNEKQLRDKATEEGKTISDDTLLENTINQIYVMLRTAKFIKGEELKDGE